jgi:hypothetical protein
MQDSTALNPNKPIIGGLIYEDVYNNGGSWLMSGKKLNRIGVQNTQFELLI